MTTANGAAATSEGKKAVGAGGEFREFRWVRLDDIEAVDADNGRTEYEDVDELAESIKATGRVVTPITLVELPKGAPLGPEGKRLRVMQGFTRYLALRKLGWKGEIPAMVCRYGDDAAIYTDNLVENVARRDMHPADVAARLRMLEDNYHVDRKELVRRTTLSRKYVANLIRADEKLVEVVKKAWRKRDIPWRVVVGWAPLPEEEQLAALEAWEDEQERLSEEPKRRGKKKAAAAFGGEAGAGSTDEEDDAGERSGAHPYRTRVEVQAKLDDLQAKQDGIDGDERLIVKGEIAALRWVLEERQRL